MRKLRRTIAASLKHCQLVRLTDRRILLEKLEAFLYMLKEDEMSFHPLSIKSKFHIRQSGSSSYHGE